MSRRALAHAETHEWRENEVVLLVANEDERLGHVVRELSKAFHGLGAGGVEASDVDGKVALEVGYGDGKWVRSVGFGAGVCCGVEEVG
jgi:hypothetical protein